MTVWLSNDENPRTPLSNSCAYLDSHITAWFFNDSQYYWDCVTVHQHIGLRQNFAEFANWDILWPECLQTTCESLARWSDTLTDKNNCTRHFTPAQHHLTTSLVRWILHQLNHEIRRSRTNIPHLRIIVGDPFGCAIILGPFEFLDTIYQISRTNKGIPNEAVWTNRTWHQ